MFFLYYIEKVEKGCISWLLICDQLLLLSNCAAGLTETCAGSFVSIPNEQTMLGTVGPPVPNVDARLESVPEMGYDALSTTPRGEICIRGETLFSGYHKREDLTNEVLVDGWFHTGVVYLCLDLILGSLEQCIHIP